MSARDRTDRPERLEAAVQELAAMLRHAREGTGMALARVARELNMSTSAVRAWESGANWPRVDHLDELGDLYGWDMPTRLGAFIRLAACVREFRRWKRRRRGPWAARPKQA